MAAMVIWFGVFVVIAAWAGELAWVANAAASRGRSQVGWVAVAVNISLVCAALVWVVPIDAIASDGDVVAPVVTVLLLLVPMFVALLGLALWLRRRPVKVPAVRLWPVACRINGPGKLEILDDRLRLHWHGHTQVVPRAQLYSIAPDGECLRLAWGQSELLLMPMLPPQSRDGRIEQSQTLARLLAPALPTAIQVTRARR